MKKGILITILFFYTLATFGVRLNYFYCCGQLKAVSWAIVPDHQKTCPVKKGKNCCDNKTVNHKIAVDQKDNNSPAAATTHYSIVAACWPARYASVCCKASSEVKQYTGPPLLALRNPQLFFCNFRI